MRVFLVDDQTMFRQGVKSLLERAGSFLVSGESTTVFQALGLMRDRGTDVVVLDTRHGGMREMPSAVATLKEAFPKISVLVVSRHLDPVTVRETLAAGADGFLPKTADSNELFRALRLVNEGGYFIHTDILGWVVDEFRKGRRDPAPEENLSERDKRLIELVSEGMNNKEISEALFVSVSTVKNDLRTLFHCFRVSDRTKLVVEAMNRGVLNALSHRRESNAS